MGKWREPEEVIAEIERKYPNLKYLGGYKGVCKKCKWMCINCGYIFETKPNTILNSKSKIYCARCSHRIPFTAEEVDAMIVKDTKGKIHMILDTFSTTSKKALMECVNGHKWWVRPVDIYGSGKYRCPYCSHHAKYTPEEAEELALKWANVTILNIECYKNTHTRNLKCQCNDCKHIFTSSLDRLHYYGCQRCLQRSLETPIIDALDKKHVEYKHNLGLAGCCYNGHNYPLRPDFLFVNVPLVFEADGRQHFDPKFKGKKNYEELCAKDRCKDNYLKEHGYILIRITSSPTKEWGTEKHITLAELLYLIEIGIDENGNVNLDVFRPYDFNRE